jgi:hypothetical protein
MPFVSGTSASIASRPAFVTIAIAPQMGRDGTGSTSDLGKTNTEMFLQAGLDRPNQIDPVAEITILENSGLIL